MLEGSSPSTANTTVRKMHAPPNRLRELREARGLGRTQLAAQIGRDTSTLLRYEAGNGGIPDEVKLRLALIFGVSVEHLMGWDRDPKVAA